MKTSILMFALGLLAQQCIAQQKNKLTFSSVNQVGVLTGVQSDALMIQSINGVKINGWSAGLGVGIDNYSQRSIPLFIDVRKAFGKKLNAPFVYADGGVNFGWLNHIQRENMYFPDYEQPSLFYDAGIGWKIGLSEKSAFILSGGFTLKQLRGTTLGYGYGPIIGGQFNERRESFENTFRRLVIKMGVQL